MAHQYSSFLEICLVPLLHRSAWPVGSLLSPIRGAQKLNDGIAFQGWAPPVQDTSVTPRINPEWGTSTVSLHSHPRCVMSSTSHETGACASAGVQ